MMGKTFLIGGILLCLLLNSCGTDADELHETKVTFYHWETKLAPSPTARYLLDSFACDRLYVKAFDLSYSSGQIRSQAWLEMIDTLGLPELVPVVFITNAVFKNLQNTTPENLAKDLLMAVDKIFPNGFSELQIDCDWTAGTQVQYFGLLREVKRLRPNIMLSCTVRLHQYRDRDTQGIPPVDRGTLMAYNTGDLDDWMTVNSIYDSTVVKSYLASQPDYPLDLDLGIAVYDWAAVYRRGELAYLISEPSQEALLDTNNIVRAAGIEAQRYYVKQSTYLDGIYLYAGDDIRVEVMGPGTVKAQQLLLQRYVKSFPGQRVMVFRLGSRLWE